MGRRTKRVADIQGHRTKAELAARTKAEQAWRTGRVIDVTAEILADRVAAEQFERVTTILTAMGCNDEIFGAQVRRYCLVTSELHEIWKDVAEMRRLAAEHSADKRGREYERLADKYSRLALKLCKELRTFENEYGMTALSAQRIQRKPEPPARDPLMEILGY